MYKQERLQGEIYFIVNSTKMVAGINYQGSSMAAAECGVGQLVQMEDLRAHQKVRVHAGTHLFGGMGTVPGNFINSLF